jgi:hypothetical protein
MVNVPKIQLEAVVEIEKLSTVDLGPACQTGRHLVSPGLFGRVAREVLHKQRTWADEAHIPFEDCPQLRQLIEASTSEEVANPSQPLALRQQLASRSSPVCHRPKFEDMERPPV